MKIVIRSAPLLTIFLQIPLEIESVLAHPAIYSLPTKLTFPQIRGIEE
jgi:hypothetical protein